MNEQGNIPNTNNGLGEINNQANVNNNPNGGMPNITLGQVVNNGPAPAQVIVPPVNNIPPSGVMPPPVNQVPPANAPLPPPAPQQPVQQQPVSPMPQQNATPPTETNPQQADETFEAPKSKPIVLLVIVGVLLLLVGGGLLYYFVLDNPKTIFTTAANRILDKVNIEEIKSTPMSYTLGVDIVSEKESIKDTIEIINQIKLEGTAGIKDNMTIANGIINYKNEKLLDYNFQVDSNSNILYAKFADFYDGILKLDLSANETISTNNTSFEMKDYEQVLNSVKTAITSTLETANYTKEITKLNNENVKKITLTIDEAFIKSISSKLLQDSKFMESYGKITNQTQEEITDGFNSVMDDVKGKNGSISIYLTLLKNEFLKLEYSVDKDGVTVVKDDSTYSFNISENLVTKYEGSIKVNDVSGKKIVMIKGTSVDDKLTVNINATYNTVNNIDLLDTTSAISYEELTEDDVLTIVTKAAQNTVLMGLLDDLGLSNMASLTLTDNS